jgi:hypothetical protein
MLRDRRGKRRGSRGASEQNGAAMAWIFSRADDTRLRVGLVLAALVVVGVPLALMAWVRLPQATGEGDPVQQPVLFDHRHHVVDDGIDCEYCHSTAERAATAGMPSSARCMGCHGQIWDRSPLLARVRESYYSGVPLAWVRVHRLPDFVYFDHSIHVRKGVGCESCHGRVDRMAAVYQAKPLTMGWCLECHRDPAPHLRPRDEVTTMGWSPPGDRAALGRALMREYDVRTVTYCTGCHR